MEPIFQHDFLINDAHVDCFGRLKPSMLLFFCQEIAGQHCRILGADYDTLAQKNLIWAIIRQKVQITRLPRSGETIRIETWPMPTTKVCYPRSTVAYDAVGQELFRSIGMWVLMDAKSRAMVLPGKSGVTVQGLLTGTELASPGSLSPKTLPNTASRRVCFTDLDRNGHMNNTKYLEWISDLLPSAFHRDRDPREFTVCYHTEAREGDELHMGWQVDGEGLLQVESWKDVPESSAYHRVFSAQVRYEADVL